MTAACGGPCSTMLRSLVGRMSAILPKRKLCARPRTTGNRHMQARSGAPGLDRTADTRFRKPVLYPLSYEGAGGVYHRSGAPLRMRRGPGRLAPRPSPAYSKKTRVRGPETSYLLLPILNILVPQSGQMPWVAGLPFFIVTACSSFMVFLARHFTQ